MKFERFMRLYTISIWFPTIFILFFSRVLTLILGNHKKNPAFFFMDFYWVTNEGGSSSNKRRKRKQQIMIFQLFKWGGLYWLNQNFLINYYRQFSLGIYTHHVAYYHPFPFFLFKKRNFVKTKTNKPLSTHLAYGMISN